MPDTTEKTLQETLGEVIGETTDTSKPSTEETGEGISTTGGSDETDTGETAEFVSGIDISDIPAQDRPRIKEYLSKKAKLLESGYQNKFREVAELKRTQEGLIKMGLSAEEARDVLMKHLQQKQNPETTTAQKKEAVKSLDKLIENSSYEQRASLEQMRQIIKEEGIAALLEPLGYKDLTEFVNDFRNFKENSKQFLQETTASKRSKVEQHIEMLSSKYGKNLIDKYRENFIDAHLNYKIPLEKILQSVIPLDELEQAILASKGKPLTKEKKEAISSSGSGITSSKEQINTKQPWNKFVSDLIKK